MNLYIADEAGEGESYVAPTPHFISSLSLFASSLPWQKFETFFEKRKLVDLSGEDQLILLRLLAIQELLCLDDDVLIAWTKNQLYAFKFLQPGYQPRLPTKKLLKQFRDEFDKVGLLKPFRKQCQRLIHEHENRFPPLYDSRKGQQLNKTHAAYSATNFNQHSNGHRKVDDTKVDLPNVQNFSGISCPNCRSNNVYQLKPSQEASSLPNIRFSRCRFCGNTFRDDSQQD